MLGARVTDRLGIQTCWMTILRRMMALPTEPVEQVVELGIDDFAFRRGRKFGSILVNMQSHKVIDLLPDRKAETAAAWMRAHPEIDLVSRDRGGEYASGARQGAPQATQIADRFHLYKNLVEAVELILARCRAEIRKNARSAGREELHEEAPQPLLLESPEVMCVENWKPAPELCDERARLSRREQRYDRYQQVMALYEQGLGSTEISRRVGLSRRTLERWINEGDYPETKRHRSTTERLRPLCRVCALAMGAGVYERLATLPGDPSAGISRICSNRLSLCEDFAKEAAHYLEAGSPSCSLTRLLRT